MPKPADPPGGGNADPGPKHTIYIDDQPYEVHTNSMTGVQIKALGNVTSGYQLFLEKPGDDDPIQDDQEVKIHSNMRFYAVPPATFG